MHLLIIIVAALMLVMALDHRGPVRTIVVGFVGTIVVLFLIGWIYHETGGIKP